MLNTYRKVALSFKVSGRGNMMPSLSSSSTRIRPVAVGQINRIQTVRPPMRIQNITKRPAVVKSEIQPTRRPKLISIANQPSFEDSQPLEELDETFFQPSPLLENRTPPLEEEESFDQFHQSPPSFEDQPQALDDSFSRQYYSPYINRGHRWQQEEEYSKKFLKDKRCWGLPKTLPGCFSWVKRYYFDSNARKCFQYLLCDQLTAKISLRNIGTSDTTFVTEDQCLIACDGVVLKDRYASLVNQHHRYRQQQQQRRQPEHRQKMEREIWNRNVIAINGRQPQQQHRYGGMYIPKVFRRKSSN